MRSLLLFSCSLFLAQLGHDDQGLNAAYFVFLYGHFIQPGERPLHLLPSPLQLIGFLQAVRHALGGNVSIEDLLIPFFCISTNLSQLDQEVHHHIYHRKLVSVVSQCDSCSQVHENGKLWPAVRASMTVVGLMPPMSRFHSFPCQHFWRLIIHFCRGGDLLVDGGYTDNLPLLQMVRGCFV